MKLLLQPSASAEARAVAQAALLDDRPLLRVRIEDLPAHRDALRGAMAMPVGSVEYVCEALALAGRPVPEPISYPPALSRFLARDVCQARAGDVRALAEPCFVKPVRTKLFTGFVWHPSVEPTSDHDREQWQVLMSLPSGELLWRCAPVVFLCEWRYYVTEGSVVGSARYDPEGADDAAQPDAATVGEAARRLYQETAVKALALDFGVLESGQTALVEANDGWALGLYGRCLAPRAYLALLMARWHQLMESPHA